MSKKSAQVPKGRAAAPHPTPSNPDGDPNGIVERVLTVLAEAYKNRGRDRNGRAGEVLLEDINERLADTVSCEECNWALAYLIREQLADIVAVQWPRLYVVTDAGRIAAKEGRPLPAASPWPAGSYDASVVKRVLLRYLENCEVDSHERLERIPAGSPRGFSNFIPLFGATWTMLQQFMEDTFPGISVGSLCPDKPAVWKDLVELGGIVPYIPKDLKEACRAEVAVWLSPEPGRGSTGLLSECLLALLDNGQIIIADWKPLQNFHVNGPILRWNRSRVASKEAKHSPDFRSVHWYGADYCFTSTQAAIVKILWEAWENETHDVGDAYLLEQTGRSAKNTEIRSDRLTDLFRGHPACGTMIQRGRTKGTHRLSGPSQEN